jgi:hypothetical protein
MKKISGEPETIDMLTTEIITAATSSTPSVPVRLSLQNHVSFRDTFFGRKKRTE